MVGVFRVFYNMYTRNMSCMKSLHLSLHPKPCFIIYPRSTLYSKSHILFNTHFFSPMASDALKQRLSQDSTTTMNNNRRTSRAASGSTRNKRMVMAKHGFKSLAISISLPLSLTLLSMYLALSLHDDAITPSSTKPFWFPPSWVLHLMCPASSFFMGISAWMVWANGGFHRNPVALLLYLTQIVFTVIWDPLVFGFGTIRVGMIVCLGLFVALFGCMRVFGEVNSVAADLIKPCLAWTAFLSIVNLKLIYL